MLAMTDTAESRTTVERKTIHLLLKRQANLVIFLIVKEVML
jgi:hypothetical protein